MWRMLLLGVVVLCCGAKRRDSLSAEELFYVIVFCAPIAIVLFIIHSIQTKVASKRETRRTDALRSKQNFELKRFLQAIENGGIEPIETSLFLKKGEQAFAQEGASLYETRSTRVHMGGGVGTRLGGRSVVGVGGGISENVAQIKFIDGGRLLLTNQRLAFDGSTENRSFPLAKIMSAQPGLDYIEVSVEGRQKSCLFKVDNPLIWSRLIAMLRQQA